METLDQDLIVERYKHVLSQMARIDENAHKFLAIYQATATAILGAIAALWLLGEGWGVSANQARTAVEAALVILCLVGAFSALLLVVGMFAWMDYRKEEGILASLSTTHARPASSWRNIWRWQEIYMLILVLVVTLGAIAIAYIWILPGLAAV